LWATFAGRLRAVVPAHICWVAVDAESTASWVVAAESAMGDRDGFDWNAGLLAVGHGSDGREWHSGA
jgi:hypothetical protein